MTTDRHDTFRSIGLLILRLGMGGYMASHGWGKVQMLASGGTFGDPIGIGSQMSLVLVMTAEFICALLVMIGLGTRIAAVPVVFAMGVAAFVAHASDPWTMGQGAKLFMSGAAKSWASKEPALLFLIPYLALFFTGPGQFSIDALIARRWRRKR